MKGTGLNIPTIALQAKVEIPQFWVASVWKKILTEGCHSKQLFIIARYLTPICLYFSNIQQLMNEN